jgi:hypothetical protein
MSQQPGFFFRAMHRQGASLILLVLLVLGTHAFAQDRDFLTTDEVEQVRLTQEPNARLMLYNKFAEARMLQIEDLMKTGKTGRSVLIHDLLEDLVDILDTIDVVADDALLNNMDITEGMQDVVKRHTLIAESLKKIDAMELKDRGRYQFQLQMAMDTVEDALELAQEDLAQRKGDVLAKEKKEEAEREAMRSPQDVAERKEAEKKQAEVDKKTGRTRKPPTLYKAGEKPADPNAPPKRP